MKNNQPAKYEIIAYEIAKKIYEHEYKQNEKISGRSLLASEFKVSSETIRKAVSLLSHAGAVEVRKRSGIYILSDKAAKTYMDQFQYRQQNHRVIDETYQLLDDSKAMVDALDQQIHKLIKLLKKDIFPFDFFTITLKASDTIVGKKIKETRLSDKTKGLIIGVEDDDVFHQSPTSNYLLKEGLKLYILGDSFTKNNVLKYIGRS